jgi:hypothetical protein
MWLWPLEICVIWPFLYPVFTIFNTQDSAKQLRPVQNNTPESAHGSLLQALQPYAGYGRHIAKVYRSHTRSKPQLVALVWTGDRPYVETST